MPTFAAGVKETYRMHFPPTTTVNPIMTIRACSVNFAA